MKEIDWMRLPLPISDPAIIHVGKHGMVALGIWIYATTSVCRHNGDYTEAEFMSSLLNEKDMSVYNDLKHAGVITVDSNGNIRTYTASRVLSEMEEYRSRERNRKSVGKSGKPEIPTEPKPLPKKPPEPKKPSISEAELNDMLGSI